ncbi:hypothetical protein ACWEP1_29225, partial [Streptomyces sp. NPDC004285]
MTGQLAFVESPVQLLNVLEWAHTQNPVAGTRSAGVPTAPSTGDPADTARADAGPVDAARADAGPVDVAPADATPPLTVVVLSPTD